MTAPAWLLGLRELVRWREWYDTKLPFFLVGLFYALLRLPAPGGAALAEAAALFLLLGLYAAFGHIVNDYADREADRAAGKPKILAEWSEPAALAAMLLPCVGIAGIALAWLDRGTSALVLVSVLTAACYSLPPLRLKERGVLGLIAATLAQRTLPIAIVLQAFDCWDWVAIGLCVLSTLIGLRFIIVHQLRDREADLRAGVRTAATEQGLAPLTRLARVSFGLEIVALCAVAAAMAYVVPPLAIIVLAYGGAMLFVAGRGRAPSAISYFAFSEFYSVLWPVTLAVLLALRAPEFIPALLVTLALVQHHARLTLKDWIAVVRGPPARAPMATPPLRQPQAAPVQSAGQTAGPARTIDEAIAAGTAALAAMQLPDGSFPFYLGERMARWRSCGRVFSTAYIMLGAGAMLSRERIARAIDFIRSQRRGDGLWEYDPAGATIPPDADTTACSLAAIALHGDPAEAANGGVLLRSFWRPDAGPFRTWREPAERAAPVRDDAVVNCNVLFALRLVGAPLAPEEHAIVLQYLRQAASTQYYCAPATIAHAAQRAGLDPRTLAPTVIAPPHPNDLLGCIQWLCAMPGRDDERLAAVLAAQRPDGAWPIWPWVTGDAQPKQYWGSPAVTTALALEALQRHAQAKPAAPG